MKDIVNMPNRKRRKDGTLAATLPRDAWSRAAHIDAATGLLGRLMAKFCLGRFDTFSTEWARSLVWHLEQLEKTGAE